ncbi:hypothetical protein ACFSW8_17030 [Rubritalea tangerina]|uniref:N-acetyltransferase domain-containing protein n=1 Tax=Rubritalea tangerina TaxID=430798 RepID=A0ABW4ZGF1_9BACT
MQLLIDTNVLIPLEEANRLLSADLAELARLCDELGISICVHPSQQSDVEQDKNVERREHLLSRMQRYTRVQNPPILTLEEKHHHGWREINRNDVVDNLLLACLLRGAVSFLVTEDKGMRRKANASGMGEAVFCIREIIVHLNNLRSTPLSSPIGIELKYAHEFNVADGFFDSLRESYSGFDNWWIEKCSRGQRQLWAVCDGIQPRAICLFKHEKNEKVAENKPILEGDILKLCTFRVGEKVRGRKVGERFLYTAFEYAVHHNLSWVYLHTNAEAHSRLIDLCLEFGFKLYGSYNGDTVLVKSMRAPVEQGEIPPLDYSIEFHPYCVDDISIRKFLVPIMPKYHERLFPDLSNETYGGEPMFDAIKAIPSSEGNTIKKAYICHSNIKRMRSGDIVCFYRSDDRRSIQVIGVIEKAVRVESLDELINLVSKRTVYNMGELARMVERPCLVILFRMMRIIPEVTVESMKQMGVTPSQSISEIADVAYHSLIPSLSSET